MSLLDIQSDNMSEILVKDILRKHFQFWLNRFPNMVGIIFDELMDDYTENDYYKDFIDNPEKVNIYWWFDSSYMRLFVCRSNKIPLKLNPRYTKYLSCDLWGMIDRLNINQFKL